MLTAEQANKAYDVLVRVGGAREDERPRFIQYFGLDEQFLEWRFGGSLGFGGKLAMSHGRLYPKYYPEDRSPERDKLLEEIRTGLRSAGLPLE